MNMAIIHPLVVQIVRMTLDTFWCGKIDHLSAQHFTAHAIGLHQRQL